jgi:hypothetical protein
MNARHSRSVPGPMINTYPPKASVSESVIERGSAANSRDAWTGWASGRNGHGFAISDSAMIMILERRWPISLVSQAAYADYDRASEFLRPPVKVC